MPSLPLDDIDHKLLEQLALDARASNREIGRALGLTEGTVRARLKRLLDHKVIRISTLANAHVLRDPVLAYLWIDAESASDVEALGARLAALPQISFVSTMLGRADVLAMMVAENDGDLTGDMHRLIDTIPGVLRVRYSLGQHFLKHDHRYGVLRD